MIEISSRAFLKYKYLCLKDQNEVAMIGLLKQKKKGFIIDDIMLVKQEVSQGSFTINSENFSDLMTEKCAKENMHPWQFRCLMHTHPGSSCTPSSVDEDQQRIAFGDQEFAIMVIMSMSGSIYCRLDYNHSFYESAPAYRMSKQNDLIVNWEGMEEPIDYKTLDCQFDELVKKEVCRVGCMGGSGYGYDYESINKWDDVEDNLERRLYYETDKCDLENYDFENDEEWYDCVNFFELTETENIYLNFDNYTKFIAPNKTNLTKKKFDLYYEYYNAYYYECNCSL